MVVSLNWFILALIGAIALGINIVLFKAIMERGLSPLLTIAYVFTFTSVMLWMYILVTQQATFPTNSIILGLLIVSSLIGAVANFVIFEAFRLASNPGYAQAVSSFSVLVAIILSIFAFKLQINPLGIMGSLLVIAGLILLSRLV